MNVMLTADETPNKEFLKMANHLSVVLTFHMTHAYQLM
jgi:hypothetical protein